MSQNQSNFKGVCFITNQPAKLLSNSNDDKRPIEYMITVPEAILQDSSRSSVIIMKWINLDWSRNTFLISNKHILSAIIAKGKWTVSGKTIIKTDLLVDLVETYKLHFPNKIEEHLKLVLSEMMYGPVGEWIDYKKKFIEKYSWTLPFRFATETSEELYFMISNLESRGFIEIEKAKDSDEISKYRLTLKAWKYIENSRVGANQRYIYFDSNEDNSLRKELLANLTKADFAIHPSIYMNKSESEFDYEAIIMQLKSCKLAIFEISDGTPSTLFKLGIATGLAIPVIVLIKTGVDSLLLAKLKAVYQVIVYDYSLGDKLINRINRILDQHPFHSTDLI
jgi:hypothetical protein